MDRAFLSSPKEVLDFFNVTEAGGLTADQAVDSRKKYGPNGKHICPSPRTVVAVEAYMNSTQLFLRTPPPRCGSSFWSNSKISWF